jgi:hypothetical protein
MPQSVNKTQRKWCIKKHGASKIIDTFETYQASITWRREDHLPLRPSPGEYALVLDPIVFFETHTCRFSRTLINGGNNINLLYRSLMEKLGISVA